MSLKMVLQRFGERRLGNFKMTLPASLRVESAAAAFAERFDAKAQMPRSEDLDALLRRFISANSRGSLDEFTRREWAKAIWGIWNTSIPLSSLEHFWPQFQNYFRAFGRKTDAKSLILTYLLAYDKNDGGIKHASRLIREFIAHEANRDWLWTRRHKALRLFDPIAAPQGVANFMLSEGRPLDVALAESGCNGVAAGGGMERAAFGEAIKILRGNLATDGANIACLKRTLDWAVKDGKLRFVGLRVQLAETVLLPWQQRQPSEEIREAISGFLLMHYKDPRMDPQKWVGISDPALSVMRRWLTWASLDQFISVVSRVAKGSHWRYREAFWLSYYKRDFIDETWVLFGVEARRFVRRAFEELSGFGILHGGLSNHCVLLLRIGELVIADWSHDGKCRIWAANNKGTPAFYMRSYEAEVLKDGADFERAHHGSERHTWQESVARYIRDQTNIWVPLAERVPR